MRYCTRCVYPNSKPDLHFDSEGVCSACRNYAARGEIDWDSRRAELEMLLERGQNTSGFDCVVPSSGGKDSHWQVLTLIGLGAKPLVVTASTCQLTPMGRENIDNLARHATTIEVTPNRTVRAKLNRLGLTTVGDISYPEHLAIFSIPFQAACAFGIPLIFYGECPQDAYGGPKDTEKNKLMTRRWVSEFGGLLGLRCSDLVGVEGITQKDIMDYSLPSDEQLAKVEAHFLGHYIPWDSHGNAVLARDYGMQWQLPSRANWWKFENLDNAMTGLHDHVMYRKFGYGRLAAQISVDIRSGLISRDEAVKITQDRDGLFPETYMGVPVDETLKLIDMDRTEVMTVLGQFTNKKIFDVHPNGQIARRERVT